MRTLTSTIQAVLNSDAIETKDVVIINIPAQIVPPLSATTLYLANGEGVSVNGQPYDNKLREISSIKFSTSSSPDNAEIKIENVSRELGFVLTDTQRVLDGSSVRIDRLFKVADGTWEPLTIFVGQVKDLKVDQEFIVLTLVSDMNKRGTKVAGRTITQRCLWVFNKNGSGVGPECGWQTSQPGDPNSCDHDVDSSNGCKAHGNLHRFGGVPAFTSLGSGNGYDGTGGGWGSGSGGGWCVHPDSWILCRTPNNLNFWLRAYQVKSGETLVSVDKFGRLVRSNVVEVSKGTTTRLYTITTDKGFGITCSPSHPIITSLEDRVGTPAHMVKLDDKVLVYDSDLSYQDSVKSIEVVNTSSNVILFKLEEPYHLYVGGNNKKGGIWFHNMKPIYTDGYEQMYNIGYLN